MGQAPTRPLSGQEDSSSELLSVVASRPATIDISGLPDLSPFPRRLDIAKVAAREREKRLAAGGGGGKASRSMRMSAKTLRKKQASIYGKKPPQLVSRKSGSIVAGRAARLSNALPLPLTANTPENGAPFLSSDLLPRTSPILVQSVPIPRIDIVESSPLLLQPSVHASILMMSPTPSPTLPTFSRSASLPTILPESPCRNDAEKPPAPLAGSEREPPRRSLSASGLLTTSLPFPGTPSIEISFEEAVQGCMDRQRGHEEPAQVALPVVDRQCADSSTLYDSDSASHSSHSSHVSGQSAVTQEIRILRVTNPDSRLPSATSSEDEAAARQPAPALVSGPPAVTLATKRNISAPPAHIKVFSETPMQDATRLSPITPISASSSRSSAQTTSTAATSIPPSPARSNISKRNSQAQAGLGVASQAPVLPDPFEGMEAFASAFGIVNYPVLEPSSARSSKPRSISAQVLSSPNARRSSGSGFKIPKGGSRSRSNSHSSSDGDRSGTYSSGSGMTGSSGQAGEGTSGRVKKRRQHGKNSPSTAPSTPTKRKDYQLGHPLRVLPNQLRKTSAPPALISLNLDLNVPRQASPAGLGLAPPRSPRPSATPLLGFHLDDNVYHDDFPSASSLVPTVAIPKPVVEEPQQDPVTELDMLKVRPLLPTIQQSTRIDWDMTDLLARCGIPNSPTREVISHLAAESTYPVKSSHPAALRPRISFGGTLLANPLPVPGTPAPWSTILPSPTVKFVPARIAPPLPTPVLAADLTSSRKQRKAAESTARYEAFRQLAQMAVDEPYNPFLDANGAVRLGEYKRGQNDREIWNWLKIVNKARKDGKMLKA